MQKEFINVAAHELRTPIQPILGLSAVLRSITKDTGQYELLDAIIRNAKRLQRLTENILDVTRIESQSLQLNKERFSLNEIIRNVINDVNNQAGLRNTNNKTVSILFEPIQDIFVEADKVRIYEVISNVLKNAIQFTKEGTITIIAAAEKMNYKEAIVSVKDTGTGIDPQIFHRLFTSFLQNLLQVPAWVCLSQRVSWKLMGAELRTILTEKELHFHLLFTSYHIEKLYQQQVLFYIQVRYYFYYYL